MIDMKADVPVICLEDFGDQLNKSTTLARNNEVVEVPMVDLAKEPCEVAAVKATNDEDDENDEDEMVASYKTK
eukprot:2274844-Pleurochrysis_carterae.AAC.1